MDKYYSVKVFGEQAICTGHGLDVHNHLLDTILFTTREMAVKFKNVIEDYAKKLANKNFDGIHCTIDECTSGITADSLKDLIKKL